MENDKKPNVGMAIIAYIIFFIPLLTDAKKDPFVKYHVKQGLVLFLVAVIGHVVLGMIPIIGWIALPFFSLAIFILWIIGLIGALSGKMKPLPIIGSYGEKFNF